MWEYDVYTVDLFDPKEIQEALNEWGKAGWELVSVSPSLRTYFFKRPSDKEFP